MLPPEEKLRLLSMVDILEPLTSEEVKELSRRVPDTHFQRGQILYTPQETSEVLLMLKKGRVRIYRVSPDGREFTLTVVGAGTVFGEMPLTAQRLENAYAEAMEPVAVCKMRRPDFERLVMDKPQVGLKVMSVLSERLLLAEDRMEDIALKEVPTRLASFILQLIESEGVVTREGYKVPAQYTHRQVATMIGSKRETVTKAFTLLQQAGAVELKRRRIHDKNVETLNEGRGPRAASSIGLIVWRRFRTCSAVVAVLLCTRTESKDLGYHCVGRATNGTVSARSWANGRWMRVRTHR
jgi:CRP/FNR family cyclic AMP-dependent transcriptional regulator